MKDWIGRLLTSLARSLSSSDRLADWLSPISDGCAACGKTYRNHGSANVTGGIPPLLHRSLCQRCLAGIPWINVIACGRCGRGTPCEDCVRDTNRPFQLNRSAVSYDPVMREWLALYKYRGLERLGPILGEMLVPTYERLAAIPGCSWSAITYVPISAIRAEERGFNQAEAMANHIAARYGLPVCSLLERTRHTEKMSFKNRMQRLRDVEGLFAPNAQEVQRLYEEVIAASGHGQSSPDNAIGILLIDDIFTTGSTAGACARALKESGRMYGVDIVVYVLSWAHS
jgi:predicted amidophosphoribosyltransferase